MRRAVPSVLVLILLALSAPLSAQRLYRLELGAGAGYNRFASKLELTSAFGGTLRAGYWLYGPFSVEAEANFASPKTDTPLKKSVGTKAIGLWGLANFPMGNTSSFIAKAGIGRTSYGSCSDVSVPGLGPCGSAGALLVGAGIRIGLSQTIFMRYEGTINRSFASPTLSNVALQGGLSLMVGSKPLVDTDGDGVYDRYDRCAETRLGALVDKKGCPTDQDGDGVPDGLDRCPGTAEGAAVDAAGCTQDTDADGVLDGIDQCPDSPTGATVDATGCPTDSDGDGVFDGLDRCPQTPAGATVDALGCGNDSDGDGVFDGIDNCPNTATGTPVDASGCKITPPPAAKGDTSTQKLGLPEKEWTLPGTVWEFKSSVLAEQALPTLDSIVVSLLSDPKAQVEVNGYAHDRLVPVDNTKLSKRRAEVVRDYLVSKGIDVSRITALGRGSKVLIVADTTEGARIINRRVEIRVIHNP